MSFGSIAESPVLRIMRDFLLWENVDTAEWRHNSDGVSYQEASCVR